MEILVTEIQQFIQTIHPDQKDDCVKLIEIMQRATQEQPKIWSGKIIGFGVLHYKYESGREGDTLKVGFAARKTDLAIYGVLNNQKDLALVEKLGKHKTGKGCLYIKRLGDVDSTVLEQMIRDAFAQK